MEQITILLANGDFQLTALTKFVLSHKHRLICVDGGIRHGEKYHLKPDFLIGDLDSAPDYLTDYQDKTIHIPEQNTTDLEKALKFCIKNNWNQIFILGGYGNRADHFLYHLKLLKKYSSQLKIYFILDTDIIFLIKKELTVSAPINRISFFGLPQALQVSLNGFDYPVKNKNFLFGEFSSISNSISKGTGNVNIKEGKLLCILEWNKELKLSIDSINFMKN